MEVYSNYFTLCHAYSGLINPHALPPLNLENIIELRITHTFNACVEELLSSWPGACFILHIFCAISKTCWDASWPYNLWLHAQWAQIIANVQSARFLLHVQTVVLYPPPVPFFPLLEHPRILSLLHLWRRLKLALQDTNNSWHADPEGL